MICPSCHAQIPDDTAFCTACGASLVTQTEQPSAPPEQPNQPLSYPPPVPLPPIDDAPPVPPPGPGWNTPNKRPPLHVPNPPAAAKTGGKAHIPVCVIGLVIGTICLFFGVYTFFDASLAISSTSFGGDFYTYTYRGIVAIAQSIVTLTKTAAMLCVGVGGLLDCCCLFQLLRK